MEYLIINANCPMFPSEAVITDCSAIFKYSLCLTTAFSNSIVNLYGQKELNVYSSFLLEILPETLVK